MATYLNCVVEDANGVGVPSRVTPAAAAVTALTGITHTAPGTPDYAIQNLTTTTPYGFASQDEGNTVLKVVAHLQARLAAVETALAAAGVTL